MKLSQLEPEWLKFGRNEDGTQTMQRGEFSLLEAHGILFLCPKCFAEKGGRIGCHIVICWFEGRVPDAASPGPGRWTPAGTGFDDLTFVPGETRKAVSVALIGGCAWHGFIANGEAA